MTKNDLAWALGRIREYHGRGGLLPYQEGMIAMADEIERLQERVKDLQQVHDHGRDVLEIEQLRTALKMHGAHDANCRLMSAAHYDRRCTCGFDAALVGSVHEP